MKKRTYLLLTFVLVTLCLSAQSLVFHLPDGSMSRVTLPATFTISPSGDKLIIESDGSRVELPRDRILAMIYQAAKGDVNEDMTVDVADIATVIDIMAGKGGNIEQEEKAYTTCPDNHHPHLIDLGLPSGTKWACCNLGASSPEEYGNYYAWGETRTKNEYNWETYLYGDYLYDGDYSHLVNIGPDIAGTIYDAATANLGARRRMPSPEQCREFFDNTTYEWITKNGVGGLEFTGSNGGTIFFPAAGYLWNNESTIAGQIGLYWLSALDENYPYSSCYLHLDAAGVFIKSNNRSAGCPVRPVR